MKLLYHYEKGYYLFNTLLGLRREYSK
jgi:hypothetical protein